MENYASRFPLTSTPIPNPSHGLMISSSTVTSPDDIGDDQFQFHLAGSNEYKGNGISNSLLFGLSPAAADDEEHDRNKGFAAAPPPPEEKESHGSINNQGKLERKKGEKKMKKPRYAFQTRSQVDILDDGYRWRKYGQKAVKNNKFPRSYYRCTYQGCNVKKQVQRLTKDEGVVVTTYEGMHSHPIEKSTDNFEHILTQMQIYASTY